MDQNNYVKNPRKNYYSYFQKVNNFLSGFEIPLQKSLNESLNVDNEQVESPIQMDIMTFKNDLKKVIEKLEQSNDLEVIPPNILKIKTFAKQPIFICGYNICGNLALKKELFDRFQITDQTLLSVCFDKSNRQLLFIVEDSTKMVCYDLKQDVLELYNNVSTNEKIPFVKLLGNNYLGKIKELIHNNIVVIYFNESSLMLKFTDNLYCDTKYAEYVSKVQSKIQQTSIIKK